VKRKSIVRPLIYSIIFILITGLVTAILGLSIANTSIGGGTGYKAVFTDVTGLNVGDDVDIAGVRVGEVTSIGVYGTNQAEVGFTLEPGHPLPASTTATIFYKNLVGARYIELGQGTGPVGQMLQPGGTIPISQTTPALNLTQLFNGFGPLFEALTPGDVNKLASEIIAVLQGEGPTVTSLVSSVGQLTTTVAAKEKILDAVIKNLTATVNTVNGRGTELADLVTTLSQLVTGFAADRVPIGNAISSISQLTNATAGLLQGIRPPLKGDIAQLSRLTGTLAGSDVLLSTFLKNLPVKQADIFRMASYGSWLNLFECTATVSGVTEAYGPPPHGVVSTAARCKA
jgi:phospholipid/cholesterol/gamma-HCH transport system substrate-binding protein